MNKKNIKRQTYSKNIINMAGDNGLDGFSNISAYYSNQVEFLLKYFKKRLKLISFHTFLPQTVLS